MILPTNTAKMARTVPGLFSESVMVFTMEEVFSSPLFSLRMKT